MSGEIKDRIPIGTALANSRRKAGWASKDSGKENVGRLIKRRSPYSFVIGHIDDMNG